MKDSISQFEVDMGTRCRFSDVVTIDLALLYVQENENMLFAIDEGLRRLAARVWEQTTVLQS